MINISFGIIWFDFDIFLFYLSMFNISAVSRFLKLKTIIKPLLKPDSKKKTKHKA